MLIGYARVSTRLTQDPVHQTNALEAMGVHPARIYVDHGYTGTNTKRPALAEAMAAVREGDTLVVTKLDRLARSVIDAHRLAGEITAKGAKLRVGESVHDPRDPMGKLLFTCLAMIAEFEADLISIRTRDGLVTARAKGRMRGKPPKLSAPLERRLVADYRSGEYTVAELCETYGIARATVYRALDRAGGCGVIGSESA
jgi:DNA invertase Pin-like site-specific DNA recombinase